VNPSAQHNRRSRELEAARRISEALFQHLSVDELVEQALKIALEVVNCEEGSVLMAKPETEELVFFYSVGAHAPKTGTCFPWTKGIAGTVFSKGEPLVIKDAKQDERHMETIDEVTGFTTRDMIALPLKRWEGHPIGVLEVINKKDGQLDDEDVDILTIIGAITAISIEQAHLFQEAKLAEVARILGDIGQDVNNLLMPVRGTASILKDEFKEVFEAVPLDPRKAQANYAMSQEMFRLMDQHLNLIQDRIRQTTQCIKGLTNPSKFSTCFIQHVIGSVYDTLRGKANEKGIKLLYEDIQDLPEIQADESRLFNAFYNLVKNAISEVPLEGSILIRGKVDAQQKTLNIDVQDTGRGIPAEIYESIFVPSPLGHRLKTGKTGLGLKIVKDVVDAHHGKISVESKRGRGSTFAITLPIDPTAHSASHPLM
jgi:signal transduction histidine kinase